MLDPGGVGGEVVALVVASVTFPEETVVVFMEPLEVVKVVVVDGVFVLSPSSPVPFPSLATVSLMS